MTARLLCPTCGAPAIENPRSVLPLSSNGATTLYRCQRGHLFDYPEVDEQSGDGWAAFLEMAGDACRSEERARDALRSTPLDPDAARRARIKGAMPEGE